MVLALIKKTWKIVYQFFYCQVIEFLSCSYDTVILNLTFWLYFWQCVIWSAADYWWILDLEIMDEDSISLIQIWTSPNANLFLSPSLSLSLSLWILFSASFRSHYFVSASSMPLSSHCLSLTLYKFWTFDSLETVCAEEGKILQFPISKGGRKKEGGKGSRTNQEAKEDDADVWTSQQRKSKAWWRRFGKPHFHFRECGRGRSPC